MGERLTEVIINGRKLTTGMEVTLPKSAGRRKGRYRFDWADTDGTGKVILNVYGPLRARTTPHYRLAAASSVETVHSKTKE